MHVGGGSLGLGLGMFGCSVHKAAEEHLVHLEDGGELAFASAQRGLLSATGRPKAAAMGAWRYRVSWASGRNGADQSGERCASNSSSPEAPDLGPSNNLVLRPPTTSGVSNGGVGSSIESPKSLWERTIPTGVVLKRRLNITSRMFGHLRKNEAPNQQNGS